MLESTIEKRVCEWATKQGILAYKWNSQNMRGVPDRIFFKSGKVQLIEFKAPGKRPRKLQNYVFEQLKKAGFDVVIVDDIEQGKEALKWII